MFRTTTIGLALAAAVALLLAGCGQSVPPALKPLSKETRSLLAQKGMREDAPIFVRIFKEESELEVWKLRDDGQYALFKSYPICKWSGDLGPKEKEGDRQAPEGFYQVRAAQMNPNSDYYLAFNLGFPNKFDKAHDRTGAHLMVHGDCKSAGCYAMTDAQIEEIYILAREAFKGGQEVFNVHAFPFRMTQANMQAHRGSRWYGFWRNLKEGYDYFEKANRPPAVQVCERRYLVNASFIHGSTSVDPRGACPPYEVLPVDLMPRPHYTQEANVRRSEPERTGSVVAASAARSAPPRSAIPSFTRAASIKAPAPQQARQPASTPASQASLVGKAPAPAQQPQAEQAAAPRPAAAASVGGGWTTQQPATPSFTPAAQGAIGGGTTFQYAPSYPATSGFGSSFKSTQGR